jgi:RNA polymerase sigma-70 factor (ECF subfamily)
MKINLDLAGSDPEAFTNLYLNYYQRVYQYLRYRCDNDQIAEDLTVQVFEKILLSLQRSQIDQGATDAWVFTIAANCFRDWLRKNRRISLLSLDLFKHLPAAQPGPEECLIQKDAQRELNRSLRNLNERERNIIAWRFGARITNRQIASMTHLSEQNVAVIMYRALKKLKLDLLPDPEVKHE